MKKTLIICLALCAATVAQAADFTWDGGGANNLWSTGQNWVDDTAPNGPTGTGRVYIQAANVEMDSSVNVTMTSHLYLGGAGSGKTGSSVLTVNGGSLNSTGGYGILGYNIADTGTIYADSGSLTFNGTLGIGIGWYGKGIVEIDGGSINASVLNTSLKEESLGGSSITIHSGDLTVSGTARIAEFGAHSAAYAGTTRADEIVTIDGGSFNVGNELLFATHSKAVLSLSGTGLINVANDFRLGGAEYAEALVNMTGGAVNCGSLTIGSNGLASFNLDGGIITAGNLALNSLSTLDITDGLLVLDGNICDITAYGDVTAFDGAGSFCYAYDSNEDQTTISAYIPEPMAALLLGLGGVLGVFRRRA